LEACFSIPPYNELIWDSTAFIVLHVFNLDVFHLFFLLSFFPRLAGLLDVIVLPVLIFLQPSNYQATIKQLSSNYQATIKQLLFHIFTLQKKVNYASELSEAIRACDSFLFWGRHAIIFHAAPVHRC
jgi:hypothetical protein